MFCCFVHSKEGSLIAVKISAGITVTEENCVVQNEKKLKRQFQKELCEYVYGRQSLLTADKG